MSFNNSLSSSQVILY